MIECTETGGALTFRVRVVPRASKSAAGGEHGGALRARDVESKSGRASKTKLVRVRGATAEQLLRLAGQGQKPTIGEVRS